MPTPEADDRVVVLADWMGRRVDHQRLSDQAWKNAFATNAVIPPARLETSVWWDVAAILGWTLAMAAAILVAFFSFAGWP